MKRKREVKSYPSHQKAVFLDQKGKLYPASRDNLLAQTSGFLVENEFVDFPFHYHSCASHITCS